jgi:hypothetical protein
LIARYINPGAINNTEGNLEADASIVSSLSTAESPTVATLANAAQSALNVENDELNQNPVLNSQSVFFKNREQLAAAKPTNYA